jgi:hypothetical protein
MGLVKQMLEDYCIAIHPDDMDAQDELMRRVMSGEHQISMENMARTVALYKSSQTPPETPDNLAEEGGKDGKDVQ